MKLTIEQIKLLDFIKNFQIGKLDELKLSSYEYAFFKDFINRSFSKAVKMLVELGDLVL